jgi:hypothetical protein
MAEGDTGVGEDSVVVEWGTLDGMIAVFVAMIFWCAFNPSPSVRIHSKLRSESNMGRLWYAGTLFARPSAT